MLADVAFSSNAANAEPSGQGRTTAPDTSGEASEIDGTIWIYLAHVASRQARG